MHLFFVHLVRLSTHRVHHFWSKGAMPIKNGDQCGCMLLPAVGWCSRVCIGKYDSFLPSFFLFLRLLFNPSALV